MVGSLQKTIFPIKPFGNDTGMNMRKIVQFIPDCKT
jgi:hypothetical protein